MGELISWATWWNIINSLFFSFGFIFLLVLGTLTLNIEQMCPYGLWTWSMNSYGFLLSWNLCSFFVTDCFVLRHSQFGAETRCLSLIESTEQTIISLPDGHKRHKFFLSISPCTHAKCAGILEWLSVKWWRWAEDSDFFRKKKDASYKIRLVLMQLGRSGAHGYNYVCVRWKSHAWRCAEPIQFNTIDDAFFIENIKFVCKQTSQHTGWRAAVWPTKWRVSSKLQIRFNDCCRRRHRRRRTIVKVNLGSSYHVAWVCASACVCEGKQRSGWQPAVMKLSTNTSTPVQLPLPPATKTPDTYEKWNSVAHIEMAQMLLVYAAQCRWRGTYRSSHRRWRWHQHTQNGCSERCTCDLCVYWLLLRCCGVV